MSSEYKNDGQEINENDNAENANQDNSNTEVENAETTAITTEVPALQKQGWIDRLFKPNVQTADQVKYFDAPKLGEQDAILKEKRMPQFRRVRNCIYFMMAILGLCMVTQNIKFDFSAENWQSYVQFDLSYFSSMHWSHFIGAVLGVLFAAAAEYFLAKEDHVLHYVYTKYHVPYLSLNYVIWIAVFLVVNTLLINPTLFSLLFYVSVTWAWMKLIENRKQTTETFIRMNSFGYSLAIYIALVFPYTFWVSLGYFQHLAK